MVGLVQFSQSSICPCNPAGCSSCCVVSGHLECVATRRRRSLSLARTCLGPEGSTSARSRTGQNTDNLFIGRTGSSRRSRSIMGLRLATRGPGTASGSGGDQGSSLRRPRVFCMFGRCKSPSVTTREKERAITHAIATRRQIDDTSMES